MSVVRLALRARRGAVQVDVELALERGPVALVGPNGAGKTSLLRWIAGDPFAVDAASLEVEGARWVDSAEGLFVPPEHRRVGYVPQAGALVPPLTVRQNVAFGPRARGASRAAAEALASESLARLGLGDLADRRPATLSGGERQKVALARALVTEPRVLLLDEPTAALDAGARRALRELLREATDGLPTLLVTHDVRDVRALAEHVVVLEAGKVVQQGTPAELTADPATAFARELFDVP